MYPYRSWHRTLESPHQPGKLVRPGQGLELNLELLRPLGPVTVVNMPVQALGDDALDLGLEGPGIRRIRKRALPPGRRILLIRNPSPRVLVNGRNIAKLAAIIEHIQTARGQRVPYPLGRVLQGRVRDGPAVFGANVSIAAGGRAAGHDTRQGLARRDLGWFFRRLISAGWYRRSPPTFHSVARAPLVLLLI